MAAQAPRAQPQRERYPRVLEFFDRYYKQLLFVPFVMLLLAFVVIGVTFATTGDFVRKGVSLKGGITLTVLDPAAAAQDAGAFERALQQAFPQGEFNVRGVSELGERIGLIVEASDVELDPLLDDVASRLGVPSEDIVSESIGSALGETFFRQTFIAMLFSFVLMGGIVFLYFRTFIPSAAVILAAATDIVVTLAITDLLGIKLSTAGIAAFLMLIGYSVDTDILLSTRVLKRSHGSIFHRTLLAAKTGMTMTATTMVVLVVSLIVTRSDVISQIMTILLIGLLVDLVTTWLQNAGILRWYVEARGEAA